MEVRQRAEEGRSRGAGSSFLHELGLELERQLLLKRLGNVHWGKLAIRARDSARLKQPIKLHPDGHVLLIGFISH